MTALLNVLACVIALFSAIAFIALMLNTGTLMDFTSAALKKKKLENRKRELELDMMELEYKITKERNKQ
jgi:hypothetical protein